MAASSCSSQHQQPQTLKKTRKLPGTPDPNAEVIALSPKTLVSTSRFVCEICNKGFQREQNLQLHRRGHNLPWKLRQRTSETPKRVYVCPEPSCIHHNPKRALGDLTGIKKHYYRKHGEKKWKCERCSKKYAVQSDWKAHSKICGTREYKCECGTLFSRKDSFITHRAFCEVQAEDNGINPNQRSELNLHGQHVLDEIKSSIPITNTSLALPQLINLPDPKIRFKSIPQTLRTWPDWEPSSQTAQTPSLEARACWSLLPRWAHSTCPLPLHYCRKQPKSVLPQVTLSTPLPSTRILRECPSDLILIIMRSCRTWRSLTVINSRVVLV
ncbi:hypothetical protein NMG60_11032191 [Bertholletia excelsa]